MRVKIMVLNAEMNVRIKYLFYLKQAWFSFKKMQLSFSFDFSGVAQSTQHMVH